MFLELESLVVSPPDICTHEEAPPRHTNGQDYRAESTVEFPIGGHVSVSSDDKKTVQVWENSETFSQPLSPSR